MLCSECYKEINQGKEIQIKGSIICQECVQKDNELIKKEVISKCHTCGNLIYNDERIYETSRDGLLKHNFLIWIIFKYIFRADNPEKVVQCEECYDKWKLKHEEREKRLEKKDFLLNFFFVPLFLSVGYFFYPKFWGEKWNNLSETMTTFVVFVISFIAFVLILVFAVKAPRYKVSEKDKKKKRRKIKLTLK